MYPTTYNYIRQKTKLMAQPHVLDCQATPALVMVSTTLWDGKRNANAQGQ